MKKLVVKLVTLSTLLGVSTAVYAAKDEVSFRVLAAQHDNFNIQSVVFVDEDTSEIVGRTSTIIPNAIPTSELPAGYWSNNSTDNPAIHLTTFQSDGTGEAIVPVYRYGEIHVSYKDSVSGAVLSSEQVKIPLRSNRYRDSLDLGYPGFGKFHLPTGYNNDYLYGSTLDNVTPGKSITIYVTNKQVENVEFINAYTGKSLGTKQMVTSLSAKKLPGALANYRLVGMRDSEDSYAQSVSPNGTGLTMLVRPAYDNKTVPIKIVNTSGKQVGTSHITFGSPDYYLDGHYPDSVECYDFGAPSEFNDDLLKAMDTTGVFQLTAKKANDDAQSDGTGNTPTDIQITNTQAQYSGLVSQLDNGSASNGSIQKQLDALAKRIAVLEAQKANVSTHNTASLSATVTVDNVKADVYNSSFKKTGRRLGVKSKWKVFAMTIGSDEQAYYQLGGNQFVRASAVSMRPNVSTDKSTRFNGKITVKYVSGYGLQVWRSNIKTPVKNTNGSIKKLKRNTTWKVFGVTRVHGHAYYDLGGNQYIDTRYAVLQ